MVDYLLPVTGLASKQPLIKTGKRAGIEKKAVQIRRTRVEKYTRLRWFRLIAARYERRVESEVGGKHKRAVMIDIVAHVVISSWSLWRRGFERRVRINYAFSNVKSRLRYTHHANSS